VAVAGAHHVAQRVDIDVHHAVEALAQRRRDRGLSDARGAREDDHLLRHG
jgi:hypothetical protein